MATVALDGERRAEERIEALDFMARAPLAELVSLQSLISPREPIDVQLAVVRALSSSAEPAIVSMFLAQWESCTPKVQLAIIDSLLSRTSWLPLLLDEIEAGRLPASSLSSARQAQLLEIPDSEIRERAQRLFAAAPTSEERSKVIERYRAGLQLEPDLVRGKEVFERQCLKCHRLLGAGHAVGPDLAAVQNRPDESLLIDILDPSSTITVGFTTYQALTHSGRVFSGVLTEETATSVALRRENGEQQVILRGEIDVMAASQVSMMPSGIEKEVSPQDLVSVIGYLRTALKTEAPEHRPAPYRDGLAAEPAA